jgi:four helix bundle protein
MTKINKFEDLEIWQQASDIALEIYNITSPDNIKHEYRLKEQLQSASLSISNNIAEGFEYNNNKDFIKFLRYAKGSTGEVRSMLNFLLRAQHISEEDHKILYDRLIQLSKQIKSFITYLINFEKNKSKNK